MKYPVILINSITFMNKCHQTIEMLSLYYASLPNDVHKYISVLIL